MLRDGGANRLRGGDFLGLELCSADSVIATEVPHQYRSPDLWIIETNVQHWRQRARLGFGYPRKINRIAHPAGRR